MAKSNQQDVSVRLAGSGGAWQILRRTDGAPGITTNMENPNEIDSSGQDSSMLLTSISVGGDMSIALSAKTFDVLIQNVFGNEFDASGQLVIGQNTPKLEFLVRYKDISRGYLIGEANVSQMQLAIAAGAVLTGSFSLVGEDFDADYDYSGDTFENETTTKPFNCAQDVNSITIQSGDDVDISNVCVNTMNVTINRNYQEDPCVGHLVAHQFKGTATVSGDISIALTQSTFALLDYSIKEREFKLAIDLDDGDAATQTVNKYLLELFRAKFSVEMPSAGRDSILRPSVNFTALKDPTIQSSVRLTRDYDVAPAADPAA